MLIFNRHELVVDLQQATFVRRASRHNADDADRPAERAAAAAEEGAGGGGGGGGERGKVGCVCQRLCARDSVHSAARNEHNTHKPSACARTLSPTCVRVCPSRQSVTRTLAYACSMQQVHTRTHKHAGASACRAMPEGQNAPVGGVVLEKETDAQFVWAGLIQPAPGTHVHF